jgi:2-polyprenyl-3-methyl-5-hydroxy-6-metoxy-1,4-benzoquinol methylase
MAVVAALASPLMAYVDLYDPDEDFDRWYTDATARAIGRWIRPDDTVLELGCATGRMSAAFADRGAVVTGVDLALPYLERARARALPGATFIEADIVDVVVPGSFDHVMMANVVHEVPEPAALFAVAARHVAPGGYVHVSLQNPSSIHRMLGYEMGLIDGLDEVSERGRRYSTIRILDAAELEQLGRAAGLEPIHREGVMLKPLPNALMAELPDAVLEGLVAVARHYSDIAAMNYLAFRAPRPPAPSDG